MSTRADGRTPDQLRPVTFERDFTSMSAGSTLVSFGNTRVLCTASVDADVPRWLRGENRGWVTAEYSMLPGSSPERVRRKIGGRTQEIQRLIGRSLRSVCNLEALGERQIIVDCDVLQADGGTRTASICGGFVALHDAITRLIQAGELGEHPLDDACAAISVGIIDGEARLDLPYEEDSRAEVDMNVVVAANGDLIEVQGTAEGRTFARPMLDQMLDLAVSGTAQIMDMQRSLLADPPAER